ncbi:MAG: right-handed parallel beta-helix repeat-containing protein [Phycisphaeraceae bacterium]|nr:right-handed parallel beta-helix repeat-containing protein [Phycisphaeraceae bacterium]
MNGHLRLFILLGLFGTLQAPGHGAENLRQLLAKELSAGKKRIIIPPGRYRLTPNNRVHLDLSGLRDVRIDAEGVELVCTETTRAISITDCRNLTIRGLTVDYDPLPFTQGRIMAMAPDKKWIDFQIIKGYPEEGVQPNKFEIFDPQTDTLRTGTYHNITLERLPAAGRPARYRVTKPGHYRFNAETHLEQVGDIVAIACSHAPGGSIPHIVHLKNCTNVTLEGVTLYAGPTFGFLENDCDRTRYLRCRVDRRPVQGDLRPRGYRRVRSLNADAFHSKNATRGPVISECVARFQGDDCVNINGDYHMAMAANDRQVRVLAKRHMTIQAGDTLEFVAPDGRRLPNAVAKAVRRDGDIQESERQFLQQLKLRPDIKKARVFLRRAFLITLDRAMDLPRGSLVCSSNRLGNGFVIKDNEFGFIRSRGILIKAGDGLISGNRLTGCWGEAIKVAPEVYWLEAGNSGNVEIRDNRIQDGRSVSIAVYAFGGNGDVAPAGAHRNITISGNRIDNAPWPGILVTSTAGLTIESNSLQLNRDRKPPGWYLRRFKIPQIKPVVKLNVRP